MNDIEIVKALNRRDESALTAVNEKYGRLMHFVAYNMLGSNSDSEECVNDALLEIWNSIPPQNPANLQSYSVMIVRRLAIRRVRYNTAQKRYSEILPFDELEDYIADDSRLDDGKIIPALYSFLSKLSKGDRRIFMQRYYLMMPIAKISLDSRLSEGTVTSKLTRMRAKLKRVLADMGVYL